MTKSRTKLIIINSSIEEESMRAKLEPKDRLILALDVDTFDQAETLVSQLKDYINIFKIGKQVFTSVGPKAVDLVHKNGCKVFLDLKYHDIPNTAARAGEEATRLKVFMYNLHALGGYEMMEKAVLATERTSKALGIQKPLLIAVTILTSINQKTLNAVGICKDIKEEVVDLAKLAQQAGMDGVVASPQEISDIRSACGESFVIVTPGVRPLWSFADDHQRMMAPKEAIQRGADFIVVGRPIRQAENPVKAVKRILEEIS